MITVVTPLHSSFKVRKSRNKISLHPKSCCFRKAICEHVSTWYWTSLGRSFA